MSLGHHHEVEGGLTICKAATLCARSCPLPASHFPFFLPVLAVITPYVHCTINNSILYSFNISWIPPHTATTAPLVKAADGLLVLGLIYFKQSKISRHPSHFLGEWMEKTLTQEIMFIMIKNGLFISGATSGCPQTQHCWGLFNILKLQPLLSTGIYKDLISFPSLLHTVTLIILPFRL